MRHLLRDLLAVVEVLPRGSRRFLVTYAWLSALLALLDVAALGLLALALPGMLSGSDVDLLGVARLDSSADFAVLLGVVSAVIIAKSVLAILLTRAGTRRFAEHELAIGQRLLLAHLRAPWTDRLRKNSAELVRSTDVGVGNTVAGVLIPATSMAGEVATFAAAALVLLVAQPLTALVSVAYLGAVGWWLNARVSRRAAAAGQVNRDYSAVTVRLVAEAVASMKELTLRGRVDDLATTVERVRERTSAARAEASYLSIVPRYLLEAALVGGFLLVGAVNYLGGGVVGAVSAVALFGAAGFRIVPSLTRFQAVLARIHSNMAFAREVVRDIADAEGRRVDPAERPDARELPAGGVDVTFDDVSYTYPGAGGPAVDRITTTLPAGRHVAVVGASGAGKSTFLDLLLGLLQPTGGDLRVGGVGIRDVVGSWRRRIGYVPQDVALLDASIACNVALTWDESQVDRAAVTRALERAQLLDVVDARPQGIDAPVGERGLALSGGQRQRLGIARALYGVPTVLVLDEATSALDTATEAAVARSLASIPGNVTVIVVAHRLSTVRDSDQVLFLRDGRLVAQGTFPEVVAAVPDFAAQAALAGLGPAPAPEAASQGRTAAE